MPGVRSVGEFVCVSLVVIICFVLNIAAQSILKQPHIIHILVDDLGWAEVGYHNKIAKTEGDVKTPNIDRLVAGGLELDRFYAEKICSPSRSAFQVGRFGIHVNTQNVFPEINNPDDPVSGYQGIPINMTGIAEVLRGAGYRTHAVGKWDVGMATNEHSPASRGYDTWLGYWHHSNDYWTQVIESCGKTDIRDLWRINATMNGPAYDLQNVASCTQDNQFPDNATATTATCVYEDDIFAQEVERVLESHDPDHPLFLFYSMHLVHMPLQAKQAKLDAFSFINDTFRREMHAMASTLDDYVGRVEEVLRRTGLWEDALVVFHSDNGGEIMTQFCGGNNYPLRGGKFSHFEGGIRVNAFVSGGFLPEGRRGSVSTALLSVADWYATYAALAGVPVAAPATTTTTATSYSSTSPAAGTTGAADAAAATTTSAAATATAMPALPVMEDAKAAAAGLPGVDSVNCWPMLAGETDSCRTEIPVGDTSAIGFNMDGQALVGALISGNFKLVLGAENKGFHVDQDVVTDPFWPNHKSPVKVPEAHPKLCNRNPEEGGCLFNIYEDPSESVNLAATFPDIFNQLLARLDEWQATVFSPVRGHKNPAACEAATARGDYWGPFLEL
jgi:arylsulfatase B